MLDQLPASHLSAECKGKSFSHPNLHHKEDLWRKTYNPCQLRIKKQITVLSSPYMQTDLFKWWLARSNSCFVLVITRVIFGNVKEGNVEIRNVVNDPTLSHFYLKQKLTKSFQNECLALQRGSKPYKTTPQTNKHNSFPIFPHNWKNG